MPGIIVGEPGAERRAHDRAEHHADAPDRHRRAAFLERIGVEQHRLRQRHQRRARHALQQAEQHHLLDVLRQRAQERGDGETGDADDEQLLAAEAVGEPADRRRHDGGGHDVGRQHPVDLVERGRQRALHIGQRDIGDGGVERLHDGGGHGADRNQHAPQLRRHRRDARRAHLRTVLVADDMNGNRLWPVSISTITLMPERSRRVFSSLSKAMRTGTRCTTLTQLPVAFCGGRIENCAPVPGLTAITVPLEGVVGETVDVERRLLADAQIGDVGFLRIGVDPGRLVVDDAQDRRAGGDEAAELDVVDLRRGAGDRRAHDGVVEIALRLVERGLGLRIFGELLERQVGIAEQLIERACRAAGRRIAPATAPSPCRAMAVSTSACEPACVFTSLVLRSTSRCLSSTFFCARSTSVTSDSRLVLSLS